MRRVFWHIGNQVKASRIESLLTNYFRITLLIRSIVIVLSPSPSLRIKVGTYTVPFRSIIEYSTNIHGLIYANDGPPNFR